MKLKNWKLYIQSRKTFVRVLFYKDWESFRKVINLGRLRLISQKKSQNELLIIKCYTLHTITLWRQGKIDDCYQLLQKVFPLNDTSVDYEYMFYKARGNMMIANVFWSKGFYSQAVLYTSFTLDIWKELSEEKYLGYCYNNIGFIHLHNGNLQESISCYKDGFKYIKAFGGTIYFAQTLLNITYAYAQNGNLEEAK